MIVRAGSMLVAFMGPLYIPKICYNDMNCIKCNESNYIVHVDKHHNYVPMNHFNFGYSQLSTPINTNDSTVNQNLIP